MPALKDGTDWQKPFNTSHSIDPEVFIQVHPSKTHQRCLLELLGGRVLFLFLELTY